VRSRNPILIAKLLVAVTWFVAAAAFLFPTSSTYGRAGRLLFFVLLAVHLLECAVFYRTLQRTGRPLGLELSRTLFYGIAHYGEAKALADSRAEPATDPAKHE